MSESLELFVNTLTAESKYSLCNSENLPQSFEMQLPKKQKSFYDFFLHFGIYS